MCTYKMYTAEIKTHFGSKRVMEAKAVTRKRAVSYFSEFGEIISIKEQANDK